MSRVPWYSGTAPSTPAPPGAAYGTLTRSGAASQRLPLPARAPVPLQRDVLRRPPEAALQPRPGTGLPALGRFGLFPVRSPLLRESRVDFSSSRYCDVSVPPVPLVVPMHSARHATARTIAGCPIRVRLAHRSLAAPQA